MFMFKVRPFSPVQTSGVTVDSAAATVGVCGSDEVAVFRGSSIDHVRLGEVINSVKKLSHIITRRPAGAPGAGKVAVYSLTLPGSPHLCVRADQANATAVTETTFGIMVGNGAAAYLQKSGYFVRAIETCLRRLAQDHERKL